MKRFILTGVISLLYGAAYANAIDELNMGLGQDNVFSEATPDAFSFPSTKPGKSELLPIAYPTLPPQIPHTIDKYIPITMEENACTDCHDRQDKIGKAKRETGTKIPMPASHYGGFKGTGDKEEISGSRYICTQCHVPQSDAKPLVENTFIK